MHILGLSCGSPNGNSEILLKAALNAATTSVLGTTASILKLTELSFPSYPLPGQFDPSFGVRDKPEIILAKDKVPDDRPAALDAILEADALIISSPIYTRQPAGILQYFMDKTLGPFVDASFITQAIAGKKAGEPRFATFEPDGRVLKPRVAGLIAVGGATSVEWGSFALPLLHQFVFSMHVKVVDQVQVGGLSFSGSVLLRDQTDAMDQAERLGRNVASQLGLPFDVAKYLGNDEGSCPHCHLDMIVLHKTPDNAVDCAVCGAKGNLKVDEQGVIKAVMNDEPSTSIITMAGKDRHMHEITDVAKLSAGKQTTVRAEREEYKKMDERLVLAMPSSKSTV